MYVLHMQTRRQRYSFRSIHISEPEMLNIYVAHRHARYAKAPNGWPLPCGTRELVNNSCQLVAGGWTASSRAAGSTHLRCSHKGAFGRCTAMTKTLDQLHMHGVYGRYDKSIFSRGPETSSRVCFGVAEHFMHLSVPFKLVFGPVQCGQRPSDAPRPIHRMPRGGVGQKW
jgi:hypothetical protein